jgi:peptidyl-prolyl cis-trans isomerase D
VSARVVEHRPAAIRPFEDVKAAIRQRLEREEASKLASAAGKEKLAELIKQPNDSGFSPVLTVSRRAPQGLPTNLLKEVLSTRADKLPTFVGADAEGAGYLIANVVSAKEAAAQPPAQREAEQRALQRQAAAADEAAYAQGLRARHKAHVLRPEFQREPAKAETADGKSASY